MTVKPEGSRDCAQQLEHIGGAVFPHTPESVGEARRILGGDLRRRAVAQTAADDAVLILSELVSNALKHARPLADGIRVAWWTIDDHMLRIAVADGGGTGELTGETETVDLDDVAEFAVGGRGLGIVGALADGWGVEPTMADDPYAPKTVWAEIRIHGRHAAGRPPDKPRKDRLRRLRFARRIKASLRHGGSPEPGTVEPISGSAAWIPRYRQVRLSSAR